MATILQTKSVYFNDIVMLPKLGKVKSRKDVPNELYRVVVSPMISVIGETFVVEAAKLGLSVTLPRFIDIKTKKYLYNLFQINRIKIKNSQLCFISIGMNEEDKGIKELSEETDGISWLIDIANGYVPHLKEAVEKLSNVLGKNLQNLMVGNVITSEGSDNLIQNIKPFCDNLFIRIGVGNGSPCSTSDNAGVNRGQITELIECSESDTYKKNETNCFLASDGGIKNGGYVLKAFGAGASYVLMGGYFSKALEAESNINGDGTYFGCASEKQNKLAGLDKHSEGKERQINKEELKPLSYLVKELWGGISSGISYSGYKSVNEFISNGVFEIKQNSLPPRIRY